MFAAFLVRKKLEVRNNTKVELKSSDFPAGDQMGEQFGYAISDRVDKNIAGFYPVGQNCGVNATTG